MWPVGSHRSSIRRDTRGLGMQYQLLANLVTGEISKSELIVWKAALYDVSYNSNYRAIQGPALLKAFPDLYLIPLSLILVNFFFIRSSYGPSGVTIGEVFPAVSLSCVALALCPGSREPKQAPRLTATGQQREKPKLRLGSVTTLHLPDSNPTSACPLFCAAFSHSQGRPKNGWCDAFYRNTNWGGLI